MGDCRDGGHVVRYEPGDDPDEVRCDCGALTLAEYRSLLAAAPAWDGSE